MFGKTEPTIENRDLEFDFHALAVLNFVGFQRPSDLEIPLEGRNHVPEYSSPDCPR